MPDERLGYRPVPEFTPEFEELEPRRAGAYSDPGRILTADLAPGSTINGAP
jgi:hypothetical protein